MYHARNKNQRCGYDRSSDENDDSSNDRSEIIDEFYQFDMNQAHADSNRNDKDDYEDWVQ